jgi:protein TonB
MLWVISPLAAQGQSADPSQDEPLIIPEKIPEYPGGKEAYQLYIIDNIQYPEQARRAGVEGTVWVQFIIEKDGSVSDVHTMKGIHPACDAEAERLVGASEKWIPGMQNGQPVRTKFVMPIRFELKMERRKKKKS